MVHIWSKRCALEDEATWQAKLALAGAENVVVNNTRGRKSIRLDVYLEDARQAEQLKQLFGGELKALKDENWAALGDQRPILVKVRDRLIITSESSPEALTQLRKKHPKRLVLSIPPELAFGTGDHATTANCLRLLTDVAKERQAGQWSLLDLGTGTGVLAIAAKALGAHKVEGWENDPLAIEVAKRNVLANGFEAQSIPIRKRDVLTWKPRKPAYDVVAANLFSEILIEIFPKIRQALKPNGTLIISGILDHQAKETFAAAKKAGFKFAVVKQRGAWVAARTC